MADIHKQLEVAAKEVERCRVKKKRIWQMEGYGPKYQVSLRAYDDAVNKYNQLVRDPYRKQHKPG